MSAGSLAGEPMSSELVLALPDSRRSSTATSCLTCEIANIPCDGVKPICSSCHVQNGLCVWSTQSAQGSRHSDSDAASCAESNDTSYDGWSIAPLGFDDPSALHGSSTSFLQAERTKHAFQYICENGHTIMRHSLPLIESLKRFNVFKFGFPMARTFPAQINVYLALGAIHLSHSSAVYAEDAQRYYLATIHDMRQALSQTANTVPPEWLCIAAGLLSVFEMFHFIDPKIRKAHFFGFHKLMQLRLQHAPNSWGATRLTLETYIYSFSEHCTFYRALMSGQNINYVDELITLINQVPRPFGPELCGVPGCFLSAAYKLAFLSGTALDIDEERWTLELMSLDQMLTSWEPPQHLLTHANREKLLMARLYHLACQTWTRKLLYPFLATSDDIFQSCVSCAAMYLEDYPVIEHPPICIGWPMAILNMAAVEFHHQRVLRTPIQNLINNSKMKGLQSLLSFLDCISGDGPGSSTYIGLDAIFRADLLESVHI